MMIKTEDLWKIYNKGKENEVVALHSVNLKIKDGEFITVVGPSGSGKSTFLHLIGALDVPTNGKVIIDDKDISEMDERQLSKLRRKKIGFIFQAYNLIPSLNALENVMLPLIPMKMSNKHRTEKAEHMLKLVGLEKRMNHLPKQMSGGEQQRVSIARAFINNPEVILADEPTGELDSKTGAEIMELMKEFNRKQKATIIVITHDLSLEKYSDRVIQLKDGMIISDKKR
jgi:putative ABC transport system ATP-binding protein